MARRYTLGPARKFVNATMRRLVLAGMCSPSTYLMTTTGKRSGLRRTTPVTLVEDDDSRWLVAPYGAVSWVHNVRANPDVEFTRGRRTQQFRAREVEPAIAGPILRRYAQSVKVTRPYFDATIDDDESVFAGEASRHPVFRLDEPDHPAAR